MEDATKNPPGKRPRRIDHLPGLSLPVEGTLQDLVLKRLAKDWTWQAYYHQHHLPGLPPRLKSLLLSYVAVFGPEKGVTAEQLGILFAAPPEVDGATDTDDITRLDLSCAVARSLTLSQIRKFLMGHIGATRAAPTTPADGSTPVYEDSWEARADGLVREPMSSLSMRFSNLTHLSLAHPDSNVSWSALLSLAPAIATITHLSLAYWPVPRLTELSFDSWAIPKHEKHPLLSAYRRGSFALPSSVDWSEASLILRRLSKATYCLKWLDLEGCHEWLDALRSGILADFVDDNLHRHGLAQGVDWTGAWRGLTTLIIREEISTSEAGRINEATAFTEKDLGTILQRESKVTSEIQRKRSEHGCPWLNIIGTKPPEPR